MKTYMNVILRNVCLKLKHFIFVVTCAIKVLALLTSSSFMHTLHVWSQRAVEQFFLQLFSKLYT